MQSIEIWVGGEPFTLERNVRGMWTTFVLNFGFIQADTITGIVKIIRGL